MIDATQMQVPESGEFVSETTTTPVQPTPMMLIQTAMDAGCDPERLEKLMDLQDRWDAKQLREQERVCKLAYYKAMSETQAEIEPVKARLKNNQTDSLYADLCCIDEAIRPVYTRHGFSVCEGTRKSELDGHVYVYVDIMHSDGHRERFGDDFPLDDAGMKGTKNKTPIQAKASTTSYARRYLISGVFNVAIQRLDLDGNRVSKPISSEQIATLNTLLEAIHPDDDAHGRLLKWAGIENIGQLPVEKFAAAKKSLTKLAAEYQK